MSNVSHTPIKGKYGFNHNQWITHSGSPLTFPLKHSQYMVALTHIYLPSTGSEGIFNVCITPGIDASTYLSKGGSIPCIRTCVFNENERCKDYSDKLQFVCLDLRYSDTLKIWLTNVTGDTISDIEWYIVFSLVEV